LELGSDFDITQTGYYASNRIGAFIYKQNAFATFTSGAGSMTSAILGGDATPVPNNFTDPDTAWQTETNAYDGNTATSTITTANVADNTWSSFLQFTLAAAWCPYCLRGVFKGCP